MIIDISVRVDKDTPIWAGNLYPKTTSLSNMIDGDTYNETSLEMNMHTGTHVDAPLHFIEDGQSIDQMDTDIFIGTAFVVSLPDVKKITSKDLDRIDLPQNISRLLFKTTNSLLWDKKDSAFVKDYVGITKDVADWIVSKNINLVGIDYLSISTFKETVEVHNILLKEGIAILEGINLNEVEEGDYELVCLPLKITNAEAAPTRAVLIK